MRYKAIIFDLDGTLRISQPRFMDALLTSLQALDIHIDGARWRRAERWVHRYWAHSAELRADLDTYGRDQVWTRFLWRLLREAGHAISEEQAATLVESFGQEYRPRSVLMPGAWETLAELRRSPVTLGVLSNREEPFLDELESLNIAHVFHFTLAAGEVGIWKPRPGIFQAALERAGNIPPGAALYVGDNYYADVIGARAAGLDAVLIDTRGIFPDVDCPVFARLEDILPFVRDHHHG